MMRGARPVAVLMMLALGASQAGCSWVLTSRPAPVVRSVAGPPTAGPPGMAVGAPGQLQVPRAPVPPSCMRSRAPAIVDTTIASIYFAGAGLATIGGGVVLAQEAGPDGDDYNRFAAVMMLSMAAISALFATPWALSARDGYRNARACDAAYAASGW